MRRFARLIVALFGIVFAGFVALQFRKRAPEPAPPPVVRTDPGAVVESTGGQTLRYDLSREAFTVNYQRQLTYADGSTKLVGIKIVAPERGSGGRTFTVTGREGSVGEKESTFVVEGDVELTASDGLKARTDRATYADSDGVVRVPGHVEFTRGRVSGAGTGMTYDKQADILTLLADAHVQIAGDDKGMGAADVLSATAEFARRDRFLKFEQGVHITRPNQLIEADNGVGYLTEDDDHIRAVELRGNSRITSAHADPGALQALTGRDMDLTYAPNGELLDHALVNGDAAIQLAGDPGSQGRRITAPAVDVTMGPDGSTPTSLVARGGVTVVFPPEANAPGRTIKSATFDAKGEAGRGLTHGLFSGSVQYVERGNGVDRTANSGTLDATMKPGLSTIETARFTQKVRFVDGQTTAVAADGVYDLQKDTLVLSGSEPGAEVPHVITDRVAIDGKKIDVTLKGPKVIATGQPVKSLVQPAKPDQKNGDKMPTMLKQDQAVTILANTLDYDGDAAKSTYTGEARLFQGDTSIKADALMLLEKTGNLVAWGAVASTTMLEQTDDNGKKERVRSTARGEELIYEDDARRLTYDGDAHMNGPEGDMTAKTIVLYLKPSGDEIDRAEAYEDMTLREQNRTTKGTRLIYTTADEKYVISGVPVEIVDQCGARTTGKTLTFTKATDTIIVDGSDQIRTQTKGGNGKCQ